MKNKFSTCDVFGVGVLGALGGAYLGKKRTENS